jgi:hypothetical protein
MWHGEALYRLGVQGFRVLFLHFVFLCQVWLQQENILFGLLKAEGGQQREVCGNSVPLSSVVYSDFCFFFCGGISMSRGLC